MKVFARWFLGIVALYGLAWTSSCAQSVDVKALAAMLKQGGYVIVLRHGATNRDQADTDPLNFDNLSRQRLLSEGGRDLARRVGESFKALHVPLGRIYTSKFDRAVETGTLVDDGEVTPTLDLTEGGLVVTPIENDRRAEALRKMAATPPEIGTNTLVVTHKPNILDAFRKDWFEV